MKFSEIVSLLNGKKGLEFGGPTLLFENHGELPLYSHVNLDAGNIFEDNYFQEVKEIYHYGSKTGKQYNVDCTSEEQIKTIPERYDFIVTSHVIEHIANPIKTIKLWKKYLLNDGGYILSVIPDYRDCFDHRRKQTTIEHLIADFKNDVGEDDDTHIEEQKELHDWSRGGHPNFYEICEMNEKTRVVHHHCFTPELTQKMFECCNFSDTITMKQGYLQIINLSRV